MGPLRALALFLACLPALAEAAAPVDLAWSAPAGCPDREAVLAELERLVPTAAQPGAAMQARGGIERAGEVYRLRLEVSAGQQAGTRELEDASCIRLAQVAALSLAMALESGATSPAPAPAERPIKKEERLSVPPSEPPSWLLRAFLGGDLGSLRAPSPGPGLAVGLFLGRTRLELAAAYWFPQTVTGIRYELASAGLHACHPIVDEPEIGVCAGLEGGRMQATFASTGTSVVHGWLGLTGGAALGWSFTSWLALRLEVGVGLTLVAPDLGGPDEGRGPSSIFGRAALGLEARFR